MPPSTIVVAWDDESEFWRHSAPSGPAGAAGLELRGGSEETWLSLDVDMVDPHRLIGITIESARWWPQSNQWLPDSVRQQFAEAEGSLVEIALDLDGTALGRVWDDLAWIARLQEDRLDLAQEPASRAVCALELLDRLSRASLDADPAFAVVLNEVRAEAALVPMLFPGPAAPATNALKKLLERNDFAVPEQSSREALSLYAIDIGETFRATEVTEVAPPVDASSAAPVLESAVAWVDDVMATFRLKSPKESGSKQCGSEVGTLRFSQGAYHVRVPARPGTRTSVYLYGADGHAIGARILPRSRDDGWAEGEIVAVGGVRPTEIYAGPSPDRDPTLSYLDQLEQAIYSGRSALHARTSYAEAHAWSEAARHFLGVGHVTQAVMALRYKDMASDRGLPRSVATAWADAWQASWPDRIPELPGKAPEPLWMRARR